MDRGKPNIAQLVLAASLVLLGGCGGGTSVSTVPPPPAIHNEWTWQGGAYLAQSKPSYGTLGTASSTNIPGPRNGATSWTDPNGNFWLFGGFGFDSTGSGGRLNDLWEYKAGQWTWVSGSNVVQEAGTYGTQGTAATGNVPGARRDASGWTDQSGNLWLFGGSGFDSTGTFGALDDLWKFSGGQWTWMSGSNIANTTGTAGTQGTPAPGNSPESRFGATSWTDTEGNLWLFGGDAAEGAGPWYFLNDLWKYSPSIGQWTWVAGSIHYNEPGVYGTQGTAASSNVPGARSNAVGWTDGSGNLWLFGGSSGALGGSPLPSLGCLNDLWEFSAGEWTWMGGSQSLNQSGTYGTQGTEIGRAHV